ncbi:MAG: DEAD/DEAH box helicase family protein [Candidatus Thalassarchaeaceae archaeon]|nr:DEAD/DEAH box helicase family protein [Candidatus Thalassarchaeaceae archaeon]
MGEHPFGGIHFAGTLRPSQVAASSIIQNQLDNGNKRLHIVAPPGSGKTVLGLYVWSDIIRKPTLVLSPNSAIQAQWAARTDLFELDGKDDLISTSPHTPGLLTSLTYQSLTLPIRGNQEIDVAAREIWAEKLIEEGEASDFSSAENWQNDLCERNPDYFANRMSVYRKKARGENESNDDPLWELHSSSRGHIKRLQEVGVEFIILDECHHLLHHWGNILNTVKDMFGDPVILGLTATPPNEAKTQKSLDNYNSLLGEVDYHVPIPALVRDSNLAPYQDLVQFVRPNAKEMKYIAQVDYEFKELVELLQAERDPSDEDRIAPMNEWLLGALANPKEVAGVDFNGWPTVPDESSGNKFLNTARRHIEESDFSLPVGVPKTTESIKAEILPDLEMYTYMVDRYVRKGLRLSKSTKDHELAEEAIARFRLLGRQITETGVRPSASPVGRIMAYSQAKLDALLDILRSEMQALGPSIRAVVVTDFEKTSSMAVVEGVLDAEAGGAVAAFRTIVNDEATDYLNPILMTGSTVLVDDDLVEKFMNEARSWISERGLKIELVDVIEGPYHDIQGSGKDWVPRNYIEMITELFQRGVTNCIVGTRGLLGEGWDASRINVLVDLTSVSTDMSINQLRGRSFRLDSKWPEKVANNWDIICIAEEFAKGFDDYDRFKKKHKHLYGVCDDGAIEKGVGHVHPAFTEVCDEAISEGMAVFNREMLDRSRTRQKTRELWKIGEPFEAVPRSALELKSSVGGDDEWPLTGDTKWTDGSLIEAIANVILKTMIQIKMLPEDTSLEGGERGGGWMRVHLEGCSEEQSEMFCNALSEVLGPLDNKPRYVIPRSAKFLDPILVQTFLSRYFPWWFDPKEGINERIQPVMLHAVPNIFCRPRINAEIFEIYWNIHVSPGELMYGHSKAGKEMIEDAKISGMAPDWSKHQKNVFI